MSKNQYTLFSDLPEEEEKGQQAKKDNQDNFSKKEKKRNSSKNLTTLKLSKQDNKKESKQKKLIKSRLEKIEKTKSLLEKDKQILEKIKSLYQEKLSKDLKESSKVVLEYLEKLIKKYKQKSFSQSQRDYLEYLIEESIDDLSVYQYPYEKYSALVEEYMALKKQYIGEINNPFEDAFKEVFGDGELDDEDEFEDDEFEDDVFDESDFIELEKEMLLDRLRDMGLEVDKEILEGLDLSDPDFQEKFQQRLFEHAHKQKESQDKEEKKSKVLATDKEFTKLYKKLAKKIHPDLTTDEEERQRREILMKQLSEVWKERDYYELLVLQAKIDPDSEDDINLGENQLKQVADDLLEKIRSIEAERFHFKRMPENDFYFSNFYARTDKKIKKFIEQYREKLIEERKNTKNYISFLKNQKTTKSFLKSVEKELMKNDWGW